jgi:hypothetical protein
VRTARKAANKFYFEETKQSGLGHIPDYVPSCNLVIFAIAFMVTKNTTHDSRELTIDASYAARLTFRNAYCEPNLTIE